MAVDTSLIDEATIESVASSLDLREPNKGALTTIALRLAEHEESGSGETFQGVVDAAVGMGKTYVMASAIEYFATVDGTRNFAVIVPGNTILEKTKNNFTPGHPKSLLGGMSARPVVITSENFQSPAVRADMEDDSKVKLFIFTVQSLIKPTTKAGRKTHDFQETLGRAFYEHLENLDDLIVMADEHHVYFGRDAKKFAQAVAGLDARALIGLTGTPHKKTEDQVIFRYPLAAAIANQYVKTPVIVGRHDDRTDDLTKLSDGVVLLEAKQALLDSYCDATGEERINAVMLVVAGSIEEAQSYAAILTSPDFRDAKYADSVLEIHSKSPDDDLAALAAVEEPGSPVRIIVSVDKLKEGWDVANVYIIASMRASLSKILTEQTLGRGLRLPFGSYTGEEFLDTLEVIAHERYEDLLRSKKIFTEAFIDHETEAVTVIDSSGRTKVREEKRAITVEPGQLSNDGASSPGATSVGSVEDRTSHAQQLTVKVDMPYNLDSFPPVEVPVVKVKRIKSTFSLGHITNLDPFRNLARRITEQPEQELRRMVYEAKVVTGPDGLRRTQVVQRPAADDITAAQLELPEEQLRSRLLEVILGADFVAPRKNERAHAQKILDAFFESLDESALPTLSAHLDRWAAELLSELRQSYEASRRSPVIDRVVETQPMTKTRVAKAEVAETRFGPFDRKLAYEGWERNPYVQAWFDSSTERDAANAIDSSEHVELWIRLHRNDLPILWTDVNQYNPDFLVLEEDGPAWVIEIKGDDRAEMEEVKEKAEAARRWANEVSADEVTDREWRYIFLTQSQVKQAKGSWDAMKALGT